MLYTKIIYAIDVTNFSNFLMNYDSFVNIFSIVHGFKNFLKKFILDVIKIQNFESYAKINFSLFTTMKSIYSLIYTFNYS